MRVRAGPSPTLWGRRWGTATTSGVLSCTQHVTSVNVMLVDRLLRQGAMTELVGPLSSGRTSLLTLCLRDVTRRGALAALVDTDHAFDAAGAAAAGVELSRVLWVRAEGHRRHALKAADLLARCPGFALVALDLGESPPRLSVGAAYRLRLGARRRRPAWAERRRGRRALPGARAPSSLGGRRGCRPSRAAGRLPERVAPARRRRRRARARGPGRPAPALRPRRRHRRAAAPAS